MIYFTSDNHFGHENIIHFTSRPFENVQAMDEALINRWNSAVQPKDTVYHLGDFTLGTDAQQYFKQLNGTIKILANRDHHDKRWLARHVALLSKQGIRVELLPPLVTLEPCPHITIVLCHYEMAAWNKGHRGAWHLFGHDHRLFNIDQEFKLNVGVDAWDFRPVSLNTIEKRMTQRGWFPGWNLYGDKNAT